MAVIKCKMCGGDLELIEGSTVAECEYCGTRQTVPTADNEKKLTLFSRANRLRFGCEFDKAAGVYESIVSEFPEEAEAYWGLVLCRYGIEYVDDPATGKKIPTCHRSSFDSIMEDADFEQACENADAIARRVYRDEAKQLEEIRKGIIEVSGKEEPYDIFICYKETAENGERTVDSVIAQDVYDALTEKGYRVFFSRITLEDKLGTEYEPYIFAALNSAKIMLAFGTDYEYFNAVWVKNEWSRFLKLMEKDKSKHLIPCYKNLDPYDMPKEFQRLQGQDMGKVGAVQDLLRGIEKLLPKKELAFKVSQEARQFMERGKAALKSRQWKVAASYYDRALELNTTNAEAYFGKALAAAECVDGNELAEKRLEIKLSGSEKITACEPDMKRIAKLIEKYAVPSSFTESTIRQRFECIDRMYVSMTPAWNNRIRNEEKYWKEDPLMSNAVQYADNELTEKLTEIRNTVDSTLQRALEASMTADKTAIAEAVSRYKQAVEKTTQWVIVQHYSIKYPELKEKDQLEAIVGKEKSKDDSILFILYPRGLIFSIAIMAVSFVISTLISLIPGCSNMLLEMAQISLSKIGPHLGPHWWRWILIYLLGLYLLGILMRTITCLCSSSRREVAQAKRKLRKIYAILRSFPQFEDE